MTSNKKNTSQLKVYDQSGILVFKQALKAPKQEEINISELKAGVYLVEWISTDHVARLSFVKE